MWGRCSCACPSGACAGHGLPLEPFALAAQVQWTGEGIRGVRPGCGDREVEMGRPPKFRKTAMQPEGSIDVSHALWYGEIKRIRILNQQLVRRLSRKHTLRKFLRRAHSSAHCNAPNGGARIELPSTPSCRGGPDIGHQALQARSICRASGSRFGRIADASDSPDIHPRQTICSVA